MKNSKYYLIGIIGIVLGLILSLSLGALNRFLEDSEPIILILIILLVIVLLVIAMNIDKILLIIFKTTKIKYEEIAEKGTQTIVEYSSGNKKAGNENLIDFTKRIAARFSYIKFRNFIISLVLGLLLSFAGLLSINLLKNEVGQITKQSSLLEITILEERILKDIDKLKFVIGSEQQYVPVIRLEALINSLRSIDKLNELYSKFNIPAYNTKTLFSGKDFRGINFSLQWQALRNYDCSFSLFGGAAMDSIDFTNCDFSYANFENFGYAETSLINSILDSTILSHANLRGCDLRGASFSGVIWEDDSPFYSTIQLEDALLIGCINMSKEFSDEAKRQFAILDTTALKEKIGNIETWLSTITPRVPGDTINLFRQIDYYNMILFEEREIASKN